MRKVRFKRSVITKVVTYLISYLSFFTLRYIKIESRFLLRITVIPVVPFFFLLKEFKAVQTHNISPHSIPVKKVRIVTITENPCF